MNSRRLAIFERISSSSHSQFHRVAVMAVRPALGTCSYRRAEPVTSFRDFSTTAGSHHDFPFLLGDFSPSLRLVFLPFFPPSPHAPHPLPQPSPHDHTH